MWGRTKVGRGGEGKTSYAGHIPEAVCGGRLHEEILRFRGSRFRPEYGNHHHSAPEQARLYAGRTYIDSTERFRFDSIK